MSQNTILRHSEDNGQAETQNTVYLLFLDRPMEKGVSSAEKSPGETAYPKGAFMQLFSGLPLASTSMFLQPLSDFLDVRDALGSSKRYVDCFLSITG